MSKPTIWDVVEETKGTNVKVISRLNSEGKVQAYRVFRSMDDGLVFLGERVDLENLRAFVRRCIRPNRFPVDQRNHIYRGCA